MNRDLLIQQVDRESLVADIVAAVMVELKPLIEQAKHPALIDGNELARRVGLSRPTIDRLVKENAIPSRKVGSRRLFDLRSVVEALPSAGGASNEE